MPTQSLLSFDGVRDYVDFETVLNFNGKDFSLEAWVFIEKASGANRILSSERTNIGKNQFALIQNKDTVAFMMRGATGSTSLWSGKDHFLKSKIPVKCWTHVAVRRKGTIHQLFINGELAVERKTRSKILYQGNKVKLRIGAQHAQTGNGALQFFGGKVADLRVWTVALSPEQIKDRMNYCLKGNEAGLLAYWPLNEGKGKTVNTIPASKAKGTLHGATWEKENVNFLLPHVEKNAAPSPTVTDAQTKTSNSVTTVTSVHPVLSFDGKDDAIDCGDKIDLANHSFTIEFWAKRRAMNQWDCAIFQGQRAQSVGLHIGFRESNYFTLAFYGNDLNVDPKYTDTDWHHWSCVYDYDKRQQIVYRDGIAVEQRGSASPYQGKGSFYVGLIKEKGGSSSCPFGGELADLRIWKCVRSPQDIQGMMKMRLSGQEEHLVAYWPLDEGDGRIVNDQTGRNPDAPITGATWGVKAPLLQPNSQTNMPPQPIPVLTFDGNSQVTFTEKIPSLTTAVTIEFWAKGSSRLAEQTTFLYAITAQNQRVLNIHLPWRHVSNTRIFWDAGNNSGYDRIDKAVAFKDYNEWTHWAFVKDAATSSMRICRNGELWHQETGRTRSLADIETFCIGSADNGRLPWKGAIADFRIWDVALSCQEVQKRMHHRLIGNEPGLVVYWPLDQGSGTIISDKTGHGHSGQIHGATWDVASLNIEPVEGLLTKLGAFGGSIDATPFDIQPKAEATQSRIKSIVLRHAWAIDRIQVEYENTVTTPIEVYTVTSGDPVSGDQFQLEAEDYISKVTGTWGRQAPGYPKEEIITLQFHTHKGKVSPLFGGQSGTQEVESFELEAPDGQEIIGFWGAHGGRQNLLIRLGVYLRPAINDSKDVVPTPMPKPASAVTFANTTSPSDYVMVKPFKNPTHAITVEFWIKVSQNGRNNGTPLGISTPSRDNEFLIYGCKNVAIYVHTSSQASSVAFQKGQWQHFAATWESQTGQANFYLDGESVYSTVLAKGAVLDSNGILVLGQDQDNYGGGFDTNQAFQGEMAEVRVWNYVRPPEAIKSLMNQRLTGNEEGLVGYWPLDEGEGNVAKDKTNDGHDGELHGVTWNAVSDLSLTPAPPEAVELSETGKDDSLPALMDGSSQSVLAFNGESSYIDTGLDAQPSALPNMTWEAWVKPAQGPAPYDVILSTDDGGWDRGVAEKDGKFQVYHGSGAWAAASADINKWQHIAVVYTADKQLRFYKNGVEFVFDGHSSFGSTINPFFIGRSSRNPQQYYQGSICEVRVWNYARPQAEIQRDMYSRLTGREKGLVGYWPLTEGSGTTVVDKVTNTATPKNGATWETDQLPAAPTPSSDSGEFESLPPDQSLLNFSGKKSYVTIALKEPVTEVTHEFWFKTEAPNMGLLSTVGDNWDWHDRNLYLSGGNISSRIWNNEIINSTDLRLADNKWHHVAHVFGSSTGGQKIYVDGELVAKGAKHTSDFHAQKTIVLGYSGDASDNQGHIQIADVRLWNRARSQGDIQADMNHRLNGNEADLIGYWPLNEGSGEIATDQTANNHPGTIHNGTWTEVDAPEPGPEPTQVMGFDGSNDYIEVPYQEAHNPKTFTISCWAKVTGGQGKWRSPVT
ncbi:MAG: LamG-like jellyroll fold domain-containing protein, partial [Cyanobacteria bacterium P01_F01_bin.150]